MYLYSCLVCAIAVQNKLSFYTTFSFRSQKLRKMAEVSRDRIKVGRSEKEGNRTISHDAVYNSTQKPAHTAVNSQKPTPNGSESTQRR